MSMAYRTDKEIGEQIHARLGSRTQKELADAVDMDSTALNKAIAGRRTLSGTELVLVAGELGVAPQELLLQEDPPVFTMRSTDDKESSEAVGKECSALIDGYLRLEALIS